jgi:hypothetical protein
MQTWARNFDIQKGRNLDIQKSEADRHQEMPGGNTRVRRHTLRIYY